MMFETATPQPSNVAQVRREAAVRDGALLDAWSHGGRVDALEELIHRHERYVFGLALSVLGPGCEADAVDVAQETFIRVAQRVDGFRGDARFSTWLYRLAVNLAVDRRRRARWRRPHLELEVLDRQPARSAGLDPFSAAAEAERARALHRCLGALPGSLRAVIHLRYWHGLRMEEIAATLKIPVGSVKSRLHRGRTLLARAMGVGPPCHDGELRGES